MHNDLGKYTEYIIRIKDLLEIEGFLEDEVALEIVRYEITIFTKALADEVICNTSNLNEILKESDEDMGRIKRLERDVTANRNYIIELQRGHSSV